MRKEVVVAFGSNLGDRANYLCAALNALSSLCHTELMKTSKIYETKAWGYEDQPDFLNSVAVFKTKLSPQAFLGACLGIESALGRERLFENGPRVIDLDMLFYEDVSLNGDELTLPHPRLTERLFVIRPLLDIYPEGKYNEFDFARNYNELSAESIVETGIDFKL